MTTKAMLPKGLGELARPLTDADRIALASTALSILRLPDMLQQYSNACDMLDILAGEPCGRARYILHQAHDVLNAYSGFQPDRHKDVDWRKKARAEVEKLVVDALAKRRELIVEQEAFRASEGKVLIARLHQKGSRSPDPQLFDQKPCIEMHMRSPMRCLPAKPQHDWPDGKRRRSYEIRWPHKPKVSNTAPARRG